MIRRERNFSILKIFLTFCFSFLFLCIPLNKRPIFNHLHHFTNPYLKMSYQSVKNLFEIKTKKNRTNKVVEIDEDHDPIKEEITEVKKEPKRKLTKELSVLLENLEKRLKQSKESSAKTDEPFDEYDYR